MRLTHLQSSQRGSPPIAIYSRELSQLMMASRNPRPLPWLDRQGDGTFRLIPEHVQQVRRAFELYLGGWTSTEIATELDATWTGKRQDRPAWDLKKVDRLLLNEAVVGDFAWDKKLGNTKPTQRNLFPAVITRPEFEQTQAMLRANDVGLGKFRADLDNSALRGRSLPEVDLFHGLCYCNECGKRLTPKRLASSDVWERVTEQLDDAAVWATKPASDDRPLIVEWTTEIPANSKFREGKRAEREVRFDLKLKRPADERRVVWVRTAEGLDRPTVLQKRAAKSRGLVFWECACEGVGDVPAFFIEDFLFEVLLPTARLDWTRAFRLAPLEVARAAQLFEQQKQLCQLAEELGKLDAAEISRRLGRLSQEVRDIDGSLPRLTLQVANDAESVARHKAFQDGTISTKERELLRRRLWAAGTRVLLLRVPGVSSADHKFVLSGTLAELWGEAKGTQTAAMLVHLRYGLDVLTQPWPANGETKLKT